MARRCVMTDEERQTFYELLTFGMDEDQAQEMMCYNANAYRRFAEASREGNYKRAAQMAQALFARIEGAVTIKLPQRVRDVMNDATNETPKP